MTGMGVQGRRGCGRAVRDRCREEDLDPRLRGDDGVAVALRATTAEKKEPLAWGRHGAARAGVSRRRLYSRMSVRDGQTRPDRYRATFRRAAAATLRRLRGTFVGQFDRRARGQVPM